MATDSIAARTQGARLEPPLLIRNEEMVDASFSLRSLEANFFCTFSGVWYGALGAKRVGRYGPDRPRLAGGGGMVL